MGSCACGSKNSSHSINQIQDQGSLNPIDKAIMQQRVLTKKAQTAPKLTLEQNAMYRNRKHSQ